MYYMHGLQLTNKRFFQTCATKRSLNLFVGLNIAKMLIGQYRLTTCRYIFTAEICDKRLCASVPLYNYRHVACFVTNMKYVCSTYVNIYGYIYWFYALTLKIRNSAGLGHLTHVGGAVINREAKNWPVFLLYKCRPM